MFRPLTILASSLLLACPLLAQAPLTEKIEVNVVNVDVTVLDRDNTPVRGLTPADFVVREDGVPQKITNFYVVENGELATSSAPADVERFRRKVLVLINNSFTGKPRRDMLLEKLESFIDQHFTGNYEWSIISLGLGSRTVLPFTQNKQRIHEALDSIRRGNTLPRTDPRDQQVVRYSRPTVRDQERIDAANQFLSQFDATQALLAARDVTFSVSDVTNAFAAAGGKKVILLVTSGIPSGSANVDTKTTFGSILAERAVEIQKLHDRVVRDANAANFNVFIINPAGLDPDTAALDDSGSYWLASETGGRYFRGNFFTPELETFDRATGNFYSLGYALQRPADSRYHRLSVRLKRPGAYTLQYRDGYRTLSTDEQIERALQTPLGIAAQNPSLPLSLQVGTPSPRGRTLVVPIIASVPSARLHLIPQGNKLFGRVHIYMTIFDASGHSRGFHHLIRDIDSPQKENFEFKTQLALPPGNYWLVMTIRDEVTNDLGIAESRLQL